MLRLSRLVRQSAIPFRSTSRHTADTRLTQIRRPVWHRPTKRCFGSAVTRWQAAAEKTPASGAEALEGLRNDIHFAKTLPQVCPGCGALSQTVEADTAGFYSPKKRTKTERRQKKQDEDEVFAEAMKRLSASGAAPELVETTAVEPAPEENGKPPLCDRCHGLVYQSKAQPILHPSMESIQDIIESSPHKENHIYHVLDAADFPLSLIPNLISRLNLPRLRTQNRRSKSRQYIKGRIADVSFIITRSDLLAPRKEMVDRMMPYLQEVLREALGSSGKNLRLGNVRCVSAKRGWWTPQVKEEIWKRGGAGWVVGKVNVGKSALFEVVYPKGRTNAAKEEAKLREIRQRNSGKKIIDEEAPLDREQPSVATSVAPGIGDSLMEASESQIDGDGTVTADYEPISSEVQAIEDTEQPVQQLEFEEEVEMVDGDEEVSLLPPAQQETQYPHMPIISALPGTTAAPIRIPYGNGKGELIDLPGVMRSSMETHVKPEHHSSLVMKSRIIPEQHTLKPGQSLLIGGIIRITPKTEDLTFLAYPFTPLKPHATSNEKAVAVQSGVNEDGTPYSGQVENIGTDKAKGRIKSAGTFKLEWDVTKKRTGSLTDRTAGKQKVADLPFVVYSADILIEGLGWIELTCQVRSRKKSLISDALSAEFGSNEKSEAPVPEVEVFTPKGKFIGVRRPMNAWVTGGPKKAAAHAQRNRPRMSMSYHRRMEGGKKSGRATNPITE